LLECTDQSKGHKAVIPYLTIQATEEENNKLRQQVEELKEHHSKEWELMRQQVTEIKKKMGFT
jgi:phage terminase Nu1 subunit (DNA packaging protein)